jgi:hypothetical protein
MDTRAAACCFECVKFTCWVATAYNLYLQAEARMHPCIGCSCCTQLRPSAEIQTKEKSSKQSTVHIRACCYCFWLRSLCWQQPLTAVGCSGGSLSSCGQACTALLAAGSVLAHVVGANWAQLCRQCDLAVTAAGGGTAIARQGEALQAAAAAAAAKVVLSICFRTRTAMWHQTRNCAAKMHGCLLRPIVCLSGNCYSSLAYLLKQQGHNCHIHGTHLLTKGISI